MKPNKFRKKFFKAINRLISKDGELIKNDLSERSICHRLGIYLYESFQNYDVDCEYNGFEINPNNRKVINILREKMLELNRLRARDPENELLERGVYPDIIIHKRQTSENLLIIESKKSTNTNQSEIDFDFEKLLRFTSDNNDNQLNYKYGLFINFIVANKPGYELTWFKNGIKINEDELWK